MVMTATRRAVRGILLLAVLCSAGCATIAGGGGGLGKDEYRRIFADVLWKTLNAKPGNNICLPPIFGFGEAPSDAADVNIDAEPMASEAATGRRAQLVALESVGLVSGVESVRKVGNNTQHVMTYRRTAKGNAALVGSAFCYARGEFDAISKWKGPIVLGQYQAAFVYYTTKTVHIDDWARAPAVLAAFPTVAPIVNGAPAKVRQVAIDLSSEGWDVAEYSKFLQLQ
jgi:hypothetical protein